MHSMFTIKSIKTYFASYNDMYIEGNRDSAYMHLVERI